MLRILNLLFVALVIAGQSLRSFSAASPSSKSHRPYAIERSEVIDFTAKANGRDYEIYIKVPESYTKNPKKKFPLILVTDGYYSFPLLSSINWRMSERNQVYEESIIVGISYSKGDDISKSRARDFTPPIISEEKSNSESPDSHRADLYVQFIAQELMPYLLRHYSIDVKKKFMQVTLTAVY